MFLNFHVLEINFQENSLEFAPSETLQYKKAMILRLALKLPTICP
jgi:hypothetical protein